MYDHLGDWKNETTLSNSKTLFLQSVKRDWGQIYWCSPLRTLTRSVSRAAVSLVKKVGQAGSYNFLTNSCKFSTREIMNAQSFNISRKFFSANCKIFSPKLCILKRQFSDKKFPTNENLGVVER